MKKIKSLVRVKVSGIDAAEFIDLCTKRGIALAEVKIEAEAVLATVGSHEAKALLYIVRQKHGRAKILAKTGCFFTVRKNKHHKGICWGLVVVLAIAYLVSGYIWNYDISGNEQYSEAEIIAILEQYGVSRGRNWADLELEKIAQDILEDYTQDIAWIWLGAKGTVLEVKLKELERIPSEYDVYTDIIAAKDAVVTEVLVLEGTAAIKAGDSVKKGEILIKGVEYENWTKNDEGIYVPADSGRLAHAKGTVKGLARYEISEAVSLKEYGLKNLGKTQKRYYLYKNDREVWHSTTAEIALEKVVKQKSRRLAQDKWCLVVCESTEQELVRRTYDLNQAYNVSAERLQKALADFEKADIYDFKQSLVDSEHTDIVKIKAEIIYQEDLADVAY